MSEPRLQSRALPLAQSKRLDSFWRSNHLTITNVFQLAWALTLAHYTNSRDVCFGTITSGRDTPELEVWNIVGSLFNVLPCRIAIDPMRTVLDTLRQNQEDIQGRNDHQNCSIPDMIRKCGIRGWDKDQHLFNTVLTVQNPFSTQASPAKDGSNEIDIKLIDLEDATEVSVFRTGVRIRLTNDNSSSMTFVWLSFPPLPTSRWSCATGQRPYLRNTLRISWIAFSISWNRLCIMRPSH